MSGRYVRGVEKPQGRALRAISYNLHEGRATAELAALAEVHDVDALCLQECDTLRLPEAVGPLVLAGATDVTDARRRLQKYGFHGLSCKFFSTNPTLQILTGMIFIKMPSSSVPPPRGSRRLASCHNFRDITNC